MDNTTARIDMQRLQILNDRLCHTLDALNQLRLSAHGFAPNYGQVSPSLGFAPNYGHTTPNLGLAGNWQNPYAYVNQQYGYTPNVGVNYGVGYGYGIPYNVGNPYLTAGTVSPWTQMNPSVPHAGMNPFFNSSFNTAACAFPGAFARPNVPGVVFDRNIAGFSAPISSL